MGIVTPRSNTCPPTKIEKGKQGNGVYFITHKEQDKQYGTGFIKPCSPDKIRVSDVLLLEGHKRILPVGFSPVCKTDFDKIDKKIEYILDKNAATNEGIYLFENSKLEELLYLT